MTVETKANVVTELAGAEVTGVRLYSRASMTPRWLVGSDVVTAVRALHDTHGASVAYLRPGWLHGPHVEIVGRADDDRPLRWDAIAELLNPAAAPADALTEETYLARAREFGRLEGVGPPYLPMRAHGTVEWLHRDDVTAWPQPLDSLREAALTQLARPLGATLLDLATTPDQARVRLAEMFMSLAGAHRSGAEYGVFSLRSHAEAFIRWAAARKDPRPALDGRLEAEADLLRPVVQRGLAARPSPAAAGWDRAFAHCLGLFEAAVLAGSLSHATLQSLAGKVDPATMGPPGGDGAAAPGLSAFHQAVNASGLVDSPSEWFAAYRLVVNLCYQQLPLLGVSALQRYYFCYAVASLVDEALGESWQARLARLQAMRDTDGGP